MLLSIQDLRVAFPGPAGDLLAVAGLDLAVDSGEVLGLVGESGCGKTMTALAVLGLLPPPGRVAGGRAFYGREDLLAAPAERLRRLRGAELAMVFQEPMTALNPVFTVGRQIAETVLAHRAVSRRAARELAVEWLGRVGVPEPARRAGAHPHELSGGLRQRAMIAMALCLDPRLVIADEPTTALDVTIQAQILGLIARLRAESRASFLLITHNLAVVAQLADRVAVMYTGRLLEEAKVGELFDHPLHPYTQGLLACLPGRTGPGQRLAAIPGLVPPLDALPAGCAFSDRCPRAFAPCRQAEPELVPVAPGHAVRCFLHHAVARGEGRAAA